MRDRARHAVGTGRQLWPAATLAEFRLALAAPAEWAAGVLDEGSGRFTIGPLTEVVAQRHTWTELAPLIEPGPRAALVAHERALRDEWIEPGSVVDLPEVLDMPYEIAEWEPTYPLAEYSALGIEALSPPVPGGLRAIPHLPAIDKAAVIDRSAVIDDPAVELAVRQLVEPWTASSDGHADVLAVEGDAAMALRALGAPSVRMATLTTQQAMAWLGWAGASGGAHGRRRGAATGRFGALWLLGALGDIDADGPLDLAELGEVASGLRWWWWDAHEPVTGWLLQLAIEDPAEGLAWAISARDAA